MPVKTKAPFLKVHLIDYRITQNGIYQGFQKADQNLSEVKFLHS